MYEDYWEKNWLLMDNLIKISTVPNIRNFFSLFYIVTYFNFHYILFILYHN